MKSTVLYPFGYYLRPCRIAPKTEKLSFKNGGGGQGSG